jgi:PTS system glucose-specific IIA component
MLGKWLSSRQKPHFVDIAAPLTGCAVALELVPDEAFSQGHMGDGVAIEPKSGIVTAPFDGVVAHLIGTRHAVIVEHASGLQLLIHVGVNTVALGGNGFQAHAASGDSVRLGQKLITFDTESIKEAGYPLISPVLVANGELVASLRKRLGDVLAGEPGLLCAELVSSANNQSKKG